METTQKLQLASTAAGCAISSLGSLNADFPAYTHLCEIYLAAGIISTVLAACYASARNTLSSGMVHPIDWIPVARSPLKQLNTCTTLCLSAAPIQHCTSLLCCACCCLGTSQIAEGCSRMEEALSLLQQAGEPPLAPALQSDIKDGLESMVINRILDQLRSPNTAEAAPARRRAIGLLRDLLDQGPTPKAGGVAVTSDYIRLVVDCMASFEIVAMVTSWEQVARTATTISWLYPGLLGIAATAHMASGFKERRPAVIKSGMGILKALPQSCEVLVMRAVGSVLLGDPDGAVELIKAAQRAPADQHISWPTDPHTTAATAHTGGDDEDLVATTNLPPAVEAYAFLVTHSAPDEPELLSGLCLYAEVFLAKAVFPGFADTASLAGSSASLPAYFDNPAVQQQLQQEQERSASLTGSLSAMMDKVMGVQPLVTQFAETAKTAGSKLSQKLLDATAKSSVTDRLAADMDGTNIKPGSPVLDDDSDAWDQQSAAQQQQQPGGQIMAAGQAAADQAAAVLGQVQGELEGRLGSKWPAAVAAAALAVVVAGVALTRRVPAAVPHGQQVTVLRNQDASAAVRTLDKSAALKLVKSFQKAKSAALGSTFDTSQLGAVCVGQALAQFTDMSQHWAAQGWFRTSNVWKVEVQQVTTRSGSGQRVAVLARLGETSNTWGVDGQQGNSWSNEYDVEYDVVLCSDMQWRIQGVQVRGKEPGMPGWFGFGKGK
eukprot:GHUV01020473.1.p1 GENE.GHUV01020473.1~~GHUV01020473.1.p1  ORF type:complete len:718 (+),score=275.07 GHUV01020473.1:56-2209(+)